MTYNRLRPLMIQAHVCLLAALGCLQSSPDQSATEPPDFDTLAAVTSDPIVDATQHQPQKFISLKPVATEAPPTIAKTSARHTTGYTGAVVHVGEDCAPCHWLLTDLRWLAAEHGWTLDERGTDQTADWVICRKYTLPQYPTVEYFRNGERVGTSTGYVVSNSFNDRSDALLKLVRGHPKNAGRR